MKSNVKKLFAAAAVALTMSVFAFAEQAEVLSLKGKVEVCRNEEWISLNIGDKLNESEVISTGFQSEAKIKFKDSVMHLGSLSRVTLSKLSADEKKDVVDVYLNTGAVRSKVNHSSDKKVSYTVRSAVAVASVRGTDFVAWDNGSVSCFSGAVAISPARFYNDVRLETPTEEIEEPAAGESDAGTESTDIDPYASDSAVVVLGGQASEITADGQAATPYETAVKAATKTAGSVATAAASEAVSLSSGSGSATATASSGSKPVESKPTTGSLVIIPEFAN